MQIRIYFAGSDICLPLSYNYAVQGLLYNALERDREYQDFLHNVGYSANNHRFRLFTFGELRGEYKIIGKSICFAHGFMLEVRTVDAYFFALITERFKIGNTFTINNQVATVSHIELPGICITASSVRISMSSPVVARLTFGKESVYYAPGSNEFADIIAHNARAKYRAFLDEEPCATLTVSDVRYTRKIVSRYKDLWINGYRGEMTLAGEPALLDFLYNTGIGSKNAQGYGMFDVRDTSK